jgi:hypothetical protein
MYENVDAQDSSADVESDIKPIVQKNGDNSGNNDHHHNIFQT